MMRQAISKSNHFAFTLIELMVAVVVLLAVMVAVGRIFSATSDISSSGKAIGETLQQAVAIEQQLREDIAHISKNGFIGIHSVAIPNNLRGEYALIDDSLPADEIIRCDQLIFFTDGVATPMLNILDTDFAGQGLATRVYYGHGIQFPQLDGISQGLTSDKQSDDPVYFDLPPPPIKTPWYEGAIEVETRTYDNSKDTRFDVVGTSYDANGTQNHPSDWVLCRQAIILGDDDEQESYDDEKKSYMNKGVSSHTIFPWDPRTWDPEIGGFATYPHVLHGRVDIAATQLDDIRQSMLQVQPNEVTDTDPNDPDPTKRKWRVVTSSNTDQQELIASLFYWPRVEPYPPTANRFDQALMFSAIAEGCASFQVEWTYDEGVGETTNANNVWYSGYEFDPLLASPWWGGSSTYSIPGPGESDQYYIDFNTLTDFTNDAVNEVTNDIVPWSINPSLIEPSFDPADTAGGIIPVPTISGTRVEEYWAIFGYNGSDPFKENEIDFLNNQNEYSTWRYTPWPSALRITLHLLDRNNRLGAGWTHQFVVDLPERN